MKFENIILEREGPLALLRFNRPEQYNALNPAMAAEMLEAIQEVRHDPGTRALLMTGVGKSFHSGGDIKFFHNEGTAISRSMDRLVLDFHAFISRLARLPKPVVAAVNGPAAGAGFSLALACDLAVASDAAVFTMAYTKIGASPDGGSTYFLTRAVGLRRAQELALTNRVLTAGEALEWGIVNRVFPEEGFLEAAKGYALELANGPTLAFGRAKGLLTHSMTRDLEVQMELETREIVASSDTRDFKEGVEAFLEKRKPCFSGE